MAWDWFFTDSFSNNSDRWNLTVSVPMSNSRESSRLVNPFESAAGSASSTPGSPGKRRTFGRSGAPVAASATRQVPVRLDEDVIAFFRAMGMGHLSRMNTVLRTFMLARLAGIVTGPEDVRYEPSLEDQAYTLRREILDHAVAVAEAREAKDHDAEMREKVKGLTALTDARLGQ